jgi:RNA polymerase sigma-70 factor (sigma-E family)
MSNALGSFDDFVDQNVDELLRVGCFITWDEAEAEDLVQECLFRIAQRWPRVRQMEMPYAYARRVLVNLALDGRTRRTRRRGELADGPSWQANGEHAGSELVDQEAESSLDAVTERLSLIAAIGRLSPQQRTVLGLRYFLDLSEAQTAELVGVSVGTVKTSASRGLARLRELMSERSEHQEMCEP